MFKHLHGGSIKNKENYNEMDEKHIEFNKMRRSLKFKEENKGKFSFDGNDILSPNKKFNNLRRSIKYKEEGNEYHKKRKNSENNFKARKKIRDNSRSIFSSKRLSSQFNNGLLH